MIAGLRFVYSLLFMSLIVICVGSSQAAVIYDAIPLNPTGPNNQFDTLISDFPVTNGVGPTLADRFVAPSSDAIVSTTLVLTAANPKDAGSFTVDLFSSTPRGPGNILATLAIVSDSVLSATGSSMTFVFAPFALTGGQDYYVGIQDTTGLSTAGLYFTVDAMVEARQSVILGANYYNSLGVEPNRFGPYDISVQTVIEPGSLVIFGSLIALLKITRVSRRYV